MREKTLLLVGLFNAKAKVALTKEGCCRGLRLPASSFNEGHDLVTLKAPPWDCRIKDEKGRGRRRGLMRHCRESRRRRRRLEAYVETENLFLDDFIRVNVICHSSDFFCDVFVRPKLKGNEEEYWRNV